MFSAVHESTEPSLRRIERAVMRVTFNDNIQSAVCLVTLARPCDPGPQSAVSNVPDLRPIVCYLCRL